MKQIIVRQLSILSVMSWFQLSFLVHCPSGWYVREGLCLKVIESLNGINEFDAGAVCEDHGGFIFEPMNDQYTSDLEALLSQYSDGSTEKSFWIGLTYSYNPLRNEKIFQFKSKLYVFEDHFSMWSFE